MAANLNEALGRNFNVRGVRDRCDLLLGLFKREDRTNLRKSATEEQYTEKEQLLQDVADLAREFCYKVKPVLRKATATEEATRQKRYREHLGSLEKRAEEDRNIRKLEIALEERRLAMEERHMERRLAIEERQMTLSENRLAFERETFYVL
ncbi:hypothetical protein HPB47_020954 [Ixodes persulcatus]|uniref:Uncharacterized protein n=1 Tax=Ixodes persulcatus TaxID=34615 RepID=A0AC60QH51_IXOPE|nr:hypothetical protein HPB47_020954 [Ixodes persulcatus]